MCDSAIINDCKPPRIEYNFLFRSHIIKLSTKFYPKVQVLTYKCGDFMKFLAPLCSIYVEFERTVTGAKLTWIHQNEKNKKDRKVIIAI